MRFAQCTYDNFPRFHPQISGYNLFHPMLAAAELLPSTWIISLPPRNALSSTPWVMYSAIEDMLVVHSGCSAIGSEGTGYYETKTAALEALGRLLGKDVTERYNMSFADVFEEWKQEHYREISASGKESYDHAFALFADLHGKKFRALKTADFQSIIDRNFYKSHSMTSKLKQLLTQMSAWAMREEIITTNLAAFVKLPENIKKEKEIFTEEDIQKLEKEGSETSKIILMLIYTGMRIGELFSLPLEDVHENYVIGGEKTEAGRNRVIPIRPEGRPYFAHFASHADGALLLSGYAGQKVPANFRRRDYYPLLDKLGISRKTPHATRHTYASRARREGMPPEILQKILGHANYTTTANIYIHTDIEELVRAVE